MSLKELKSLFETKLIPKDIEDGNILGVSENGYFSNVIEASKISGVLEGEMKQKYSNVITEIESGRVWMPELSPFVLSRLLLNDTFYNDHCDKRSNPIELAKRISLFYDDSYSYWTENVYFEAFD